MTIAAGGGQRSGTPLRVPIASMHSVADRLEGATGGVCVISAPAGYGKTTQVAIWAGSDARPVGWIELQPNHNDAPLLLSALTRELHRVAGVDVVAVAPRRSADRDDWTFVAPEFADAMRSGHDSFILVLDGAHVLNDRGAIDLVDALLRNIPERATIVITCRGRAPFHLARLSIDGMVSEVSEQHLALGAVEAQAVADQMGIVLSDAELAEVMRRTEGWPVGVRLAVASFAVPADGERPLDSRTASTQQVESYLREECLRGLCDDEFEFLAHTSGLEALTAPLCDEVLGRCDSAEMLERLSASGQLVLPIDRNGASFRVHPMLREILDRDLLFSSPTMRSALDLRASDWFERVGDIDRALDHAFRAREFRRAEALIDLHALGHHMDGRFETVRRWLGSFPPEYAFVSVPLCLMAAVSSMAAGDGESARTWLRFGERIVRDDDGGEAPQGFHELAVYRAMLHLGPIADVLPGAEEAYEALSPGTWHASACLILGAHNFARGDDRSASLLTEGASEAKLSGAHSIEALCRAHLSIVHGASGDWTPATTEGHLARQIVDDFDLQELPTMALVTAVDSHVEARHGHIEPAREAIAHTRRSLAALANAGPWANIQSRVAVAQAALLLGDRGLAQTLVAEAEVYLRHQPDGLVPKVQLADIEERVRIARRTIDNSPSALTNAELRVLHFLPTNLSLAGIADRLFVSRATVNSHTRSIYRKLGASSRHVAVETARAAGLLPAE